MRVCWLRQQLEPRTSCVAAACTLPAPAVIAHRDAISYSDFTAGCRSRAGRQACWYWPGRSERPNRERIEPHRTSLTHAARQARAGRQASKRQAASGSSPTNDCASQPYRPSNTHPLTHIQPPYITPPTPLNTAALATNTRTHLRRTARTPPHTTSLFPAAHSADCTEPTARRSVANSSAIRYGLSPPLLRTPLTLPAAAHFHVPAALQCCTLP